MHDEVIRPTEQAILEALATYRFLSMKQMLRVGVSSDSSHLYAVLRRMKPPKKSANPKKKTTSRRLRPLVYEIDFGFFSGAGRRPALYYLSPYGAEILNDHGHYPSVIPSRGVTVFHNDYDHRVHCVDVHIEVRQWAKNNNTDVDYFYADYDPKVKMGERLSKKTSVKYKKGVLVPDSVCQLTSQDGITRLLALEIANGHETKRIEDKLLNYVTALEESAIEKAFGYEHEARIVWVFESENTLRLVRKRMERHAVFSEFMECFYARPLESLQKSDWREGWERLSSDAQVVSLYE